MKPEDAVNKPKFHHQWLPDEIFVEEQFPIRVKNELKKMGYTITERGPIGRVELIIVQNKKITAIGDSRGDDSAEGY
jgi:gamma-glutamyltranspeptidase/glutathione hydrolase